MANPYPIPEYRPYPAPDYSYTSQVNEYMHPYVLPEPTPMAAPVAYPAPAQTSPISELADKYVAHKVLSALSGSSSLPTSAAANAAFNAPALEAANAAFNAPGLAASEAMALPGVQSIGTAAAVPSSFGGMFAGQGLAGMTNLGMAGTALGIAAPLILGPMIKRAFFKDKPDRVFNLAEVLGKNSFDKQLPGYGAYSPKQQSDFVTKARGAGFDIALPGVANKEGVTQKNGGAFFRDLTRALSANDQLLRAGRDTDSTFGGARFGRVQDQSVDEVLGKLKSSPVANSGYINRVQKIKDFVTGFNAPKEKPKEKK